jgi:hypothetical protein
MKKYYTFLICLMLSDFAHAVQVTASYNLQSTLDVSWSKVQKYRHSADCYPLGKATERSDLNNESLIVKQTKDRVEQNSAWNISSTRFGAKLGELNFNLKKSTDELKTRFVIEANDQINWSDYQNIGDSDCVLREYHWRVNSHRLEGEYSIQIQMPSNAWFIKVQLTSEGLLFDRPRNEADASFKFQGDLHNKNLVLNKPFYLWARPGDVITLPIKINIPATKGLLGRILLDINAPDQLTAGEILKTLTARNAFVVDKNTLRKLILAFASIAGHPDVAKDIISQLGLGPIRNLTEQIFAIAQGRHTQIEFELDLKSIAAAAAYELALSILENMQVFCETKTVELPFSGQSVERPGFIIANFWMNQNILRLRDLNFPEVRAYLEELVRWENNGYTYADIVRDPVLFDRAAKGYSQIRRNTRLAQDVYSDIHTSMRRILSVFGTVGTDPDVVNELMEQLKSLSLLRKDVNSQFQSLVAKFNATNKDPIYISPILHQLRELEYKNEELSLQMSNTLKFVSLNHTDESENALDLMVSLLSKQVNVFDQPLQSSYQEPVRLTFLQFARTQSLKNKLEQCIGVQL